MLTAARALAASCAALTLTGCAAAGTPTSPAVSGTPTASATATATLSGEKAASGAKPPAEVDGWTLARSQAAVGGATQYFYTRPGDAKASLIATVSPVALTADALATVLTDQQSFGPATCGNVAGGSTLACYVPLSGGNLSVTGPLSVAELGAVAQHLYAALP
jgi:hypothetical protein